MPAIPSRARTIAVLGALSASAVRLLNGLVPVLTLSAIEPTDGVKLELAGLHNVFRLTKCLYSGSYPEGDAGFQSLKNLGIQTIISVDGALPDVERARRYDLRYVHIPVGYDGIPFVQAFKIAKAIRDLPGPYYVHCHRGVHRGPTAAALAHLCLDPTCTVDAVIAEMRRAGADPHYQGLYASPRRFRRPSSRELENLSADFPEQVNVPALAKAMAQLDNYWSHIEALHAAGWRPPAAQPDLEPAQEALMLVEQLREIARLPIVQQKPEKFTGFLRSAEDAAHALETTLREGQPSRKTSRTEESFRRVRASCTACHVVFRDISGP
jgi:hypothetical protein